MVFSIPICKECFRIYTASFYSRHNVIINLSYPLLPPHLQVSRECLQPYIPKLIAVLLGCFRDDSWPVRDGEFMSGIMVTVIAGIRIRKLLITQQRLCMEYYPLMISV